MTVRAVFAGDLWHGATGTALNQGFRELGWDVGEVSIRDHFLTSHLKPLRAAARLLQRASERSFNDAILKEVASSGAHVLLTVKGSHIRRETLDALRAMSVFTVNYYPDYKFEHTGFDESLFGGYDLIVTTKSFQVDHLRQRFGEDRIAFLHHGYSPLVHRRRGGPLAEDDYARDICYVGNASPSKRDWLVAVAERFPDRSIGVFGGGWEGLAKGSALAPFVAKRAPQGDYYARVIAESRINIAVHYGAGGKMGWQDHVSTRTFEIPACGGFMLHVDNDEVRGLYDVPSEIDTFADPNELCGKITHYLDRPELRRAMIERAHARCVPAYSLTTRAAEIAAAIERRRNGRSAGDRT